MKKILVIYTKYRIFGGEDSNIKDEINNLKKNFIVEYLEFDNAKKLNLTDYLAFITRSNFNSNKVLRNKIEEFSPDVAYVHNTWFKGNLGVLNILNKEKLLTILKIHNFRFDCTKTFSFRSHLDNQKYCPKCGLKNVENKFFNKYYQNSTIKSFMINWYGRKYIDILKNNNLQIFVLNNFYKNFLQSIGITENKIDISYNPINIETTPKYDSNSDYVVYAGALNSEKGIIELLNSWKKSRGPLKLYIVGTGKLEDELITKYSDQKTIFKGSLENREVLEIIKKSRAVITATKMFEGQPRLLFEAASFGVPSIYPSFGGMDEYFPDDYELSFEQFNYFDLEKKISLLQNQALLEKESIRTHAHIANLLENSQIHEIINNAYQKRKAIVD